jgi:hypothetical protein
MSLIPSYRIYLHIHIHKKKRCHSVCIASLFSGYHDWISPSVTFFLHFLTFFQYQSNHRRNRHVNNLFNEEIFIMNYSIFSFFLLIFIQIINTFDYNDDDEKQLPFESCMYSSQKKKKRFSTLDIYIYIYCIISFFHWILLLL